MAGCELFTTDGTAAGTTLFKDLWPGFESGAPRNLTVAGEWLFFTACNDTAGCELWRSNGTAEGTRRVSDIAPGVLSSNPDNSVNVRRTFAIYDDIVFFRANDGTGVELWAYPIHLFRDGFESQSTTAWSATVP